MSCTIDHSVYDSKFCPDCGTPIIKTTNITIGNITFTDVPIVSSGIITGMSGITHEPVKDTEIKLSQFVYIREIDRHYQVYVSNRYDDSSKQEVKDLIMKELNKQYFTTDEKQLNWYINEFITDFPIDCEIDEGRKYADELNKILEENKELFIYFDIENAQHGCNLLSKIIVKKIQIPKKEYVLFKEDKFVPLKYDELNNIVNNDVSELGNYFVDDLFILEYPSQYEIEDLKKCYDAVKEIKGNMYLKTKEKIINIKQSIKQSIEKLINDNIDNSDVDNNVENIIFNVKDIVNKIVVPKK